jgi:hypothetical protein
VIFIRLKLNQLTTGASNVVCYNTGRRSSAGTYILSECGFDAYVLRGGLSTSRDPAPLRPHSSTCAGNLIRQAGSAVAKFFQRDARASENIGIHFIITARQNDTGCAPLEGS